MRPILVAVALSVCFVASALGTPSANADTRVFIIANQSDGYGIDQCLANGEKCGAHAARAYCKSRDFSQATAYRKVDPDEVTGALPASTRDTCPRGGCGEFIAITCQR